MGLFDQAGNLIGMLTGQGGQSNDSLAKQANVSSADFGKIMTLGLPMIMKAINRNSQDQSGIDSLNQALNDHDKADQFESIDQAAEQVDQEDGDKILNHVFKDQNEKEGIIDKIAQALNMDTASVKRTLIVLAPMVLMYLAHRRKSNNVAEEDLGQEVDQASREVEGQARQEGGSLLERVLDAVTVDENQTEDDSLLGKVIDNVTVDEKDQAAKKEASQDDDGGLLGGLIDKLTK
ncbi:DUF937 domain-containing protein [Aerococcus sanguinicola]|uniref:DUF937 domain-containing protein n=1 Tax=unclassified Aerococcus TaxID=2618060 RepID=UPI0008A53314|nr:MULTISPECIES: DUF937 domain-containing protein [unclassified Aerococcus]KAB0647715.1 DUF937 domain-containing protein [Aerococcus sanguinicola]MDK6233044.1 DUF937 domain-containing protein [Aerococcus sp. UMB10185]MDK6855339.1 DUF937 domain-containing protein [Aerococcus sp. UMB7533]MDK8502196.1 DUF937 domain-containing protein [Aerococcus sp. UMB1112A]OFN04915.1 hypothetical protein HMPREF2626_03745 [Aerococcus sp. HMSC062A02]